MFIFTVASTTILILLIFLFVKKHLQDTRAISGLFLKIIAGVVLGLVYKLHYQGGDTFQYFADAEVITNYLVAHPLQLFELYFNTLSIPEVAGQIAYFDQPRALLFAKIVSFFYLFSGGSYWISGAFLSLISFITVFVLVQEIGFWYPGLKRQAAIAFYFLPSFVFWTSGLLKEGISIGALFVLIATLLKMIRIEKYADFPRWIVVLLCTLVLWQLKYFYAAVALPMLIAFFVYSIVNQKKWVPMYVMLLMIVVGLVVVSQLHYNLSLAHVKQVIYQNYLIGTGSSGTHAIEYFLFDGGWLGFIINLPLATVFGLFRPQLFEAANFFQVVIGFENSLVLLLLVFGVCRYGFSVNWRDPLLLITLLYIVCLDIMLAFSTPNFGTLSRYKAGYWPFFVLLVLYLNSNWPKKKVVKGGFRDSD
jgi:hypothetical protein